MGKKTTTQNDKDVDNKGINILPVVEDRKPGRPPGSKNKKTIEQEIALQQLKDRVKEAQNPLLTAAMGKAMGEQFLMVIETKRYKDSKGKWQEKKLRPKIVTDQEVIISYFAEELEDSKDEYHYITTKSPDMKAFEILIAYLHGKPESNTNVKVESWSLSEALVRVVSENDDDDYGALEQFADAKTKKTIARNKQAWKRKTGIETKD